MLPLREVTGNMPVKSEAIADAREYVEKRTVLEGRVMRENSGDVVAGGEAEGGLGERGKCGVSDRATASCRVEIFADQVYVAKGGGWCEWGVFADEFGRGLRVGDPPVGDGAKKSGDGRGAK